MAASKLKKSLKKLLSYLSSADISILLALLLLSGGIWGFVEIADEFREGESYRFDVLILTSLRTAADASVPKGPAWLLTAMRDFTTLGGGTVIAFVTLIVTGFMLLVRRFYETLLMLMISGGGAALGYVLKFLFARERPTEVPALVEAGFYSFPSGHAMMGALVYLSLAAMLAGIQTDGRVRVYIITVGILAVFFIGFSRVYLGVHYPTDILAGWSVGLAWASFSRMAVMWLENILGGRKNQKTG